MYLLICVRGTFHMDASSALRALFPRGGVAAGTGNSAPGLLKTGGHGVCTGAPLQHGSCALPKGPPLSPTELPTSVVAYVSALSPSEPQSLSPFHSAETAYSPADFSLSDSEAEASLQNSDASPALLGSAAGRAGPACQARASHAADVGTCAREALSRHKDQKLAGVTSKPSARIGASGAGKPQPHFDWLRGLPRAERQRLRRCSSPRSARYVLAKAVSEASQVSSSGSLWGRNAPVGLAEELRRHAQLAQRQVVDMEVALRQQEAEHEREIEAMIEDHRRAYKQVKLRLLAQLAPDRSVQHQLLALSTDRSDLAAGHLRLEAMGPAVTSPMKAPSRSRSCASSVSKSGSDA